MKILLVSGFLGAGKTRFILEMSRKTGRKFVIVENEFGEVNVDADRLREAQTDTADPFEKVVELTEGCICCSLNLDFNHSLLTIANTFDPDYLVVEPSGVAKTGNILTHIREICYERIEVLAPIVILDGAHYEVSRRHQPDIFNNQIQSAGTLVVSRSEHWQPQDFEALRTALRLPPDVSLPTTHYEQWPKAFWESLLLREYVDAQTPILAQAEQAAEPVHRSKAPLALKGRFKQRKQTKRPPLESIGFTEVGLKGLPDLIRFLHLLMSGCLGRIARAKGFIQSVPGEGLTFDYVEGSYAVTGLATQAQPKVVVIGEQLNREAIAYWVGANLNQVSFQETGAPEVPLKWLEADQTQGDEQAGERAGEQVASIG